MKFNRKILCSVLSILFLFGCNSNTSSYERTIEEIMSEDVKFATYYQYTNSFKGVELYCWKVKRNWECGLIYGTNRYKTVDEILWMQENLPCPLLHMKEILQVYSERTREILPIFIVSTPPKQEELRHVLNLDDQKNDYIYIYTALGLPVPEFIKNY